MYQKENDMNEEEFKASVRETMSKSMNEGLNPLIPQVVEIIASAYQTGFWAGYHIWKSAEPKEDAK